MTAMPDGPRHLLSQTVQSYLDDPYALQLRTQKEFGDTYTAPHVIYGKRFVTANPEALKTILTADPDTFVSALNDVLAIFPGKGVGSLFTLSGERHKASRKLLAPPFQGARMRAYGVLIRDIALKWAATWQPAEPFRMLDTTQAIALDVIIQAVFGVTDRERVQRFHKQIVDSFELRAAHRACETAAAQLLGLWSLGALSQPLHGAPAHDPGGDHRAPRRAAGP